MGRQVSQTQTFADKLMKLIPTEIVGAYMVLAGVIGYPPGSTQYVSAGPEITDDALRAFLIQFIFAVLLVLTPVYLRRVGHVASLPQIAVSTLSFVIWVYSLGGPFVVWGCYYPLMGSVVLVLWALFTPLLVTPKAKTKGRSSTAEVSAVGA
ncbi:MAG: hypothetical protein ABFC80_01990 [Coriobacteriales bacterium]|nr:hypothetical protein [Actinomycetes bacterium]